MGSNLRTREAILLGESDLRDFHDIITAVAADRLAYLRALAARGLQEEKITEETAMVYSVNKSQMRKDLDLAKKEMFPQSDEPCGLKLNFEDLHVDPRRPSGRWCKVAGVPRRS